MESSGTSESIGTRIRFRGWMATSGQQHPNGSILEGPRIPRSEFRMPEIELSRGWRMSLGITTGRCARSCALNPIPRLRFSRPEP